MDTDSWNFDRLLESLTALESDDAEPPVIQAQALAGVQPNPSPGTDDLITFIASSETESRNGFIIRASGWHTTNYMANPVFLWAHQGFRPPIGRARALWIQPPNLMATIEFAPTPFAQEIAALYRTGFQAGVSVGFLPKRFAIHRPGPDEPHRNTVIEFIEQELVEISAAPVPSNPDALKQALDDYPIMARYYESVSLEGAKHGPFRAPDPGDPRTDSVTTGTPSDHELADVLYAIRQQMNAT